MSKANAFSALFREAGRHGVGETEKPDETATAPGLARGKKGKREDPEFGKIGVYVRNATIMEVKVRLLRQNLDLSELVQTLLDAWLREPAARGSERPADATAGVEQPAAVKGPRGASTGAGRKIKQHGS